MNIHSRKPYNKKKVSIFKKQKQKYFKILEPFDFEIFEMQTETELYFCSTDSYGARTKNDNFIMVRADGPADNNHSVKYYTQSLCCSHV